MNTDRLELLLHEAPVPEAGAARERTVVAARRAVAPATTASPAPEPTRRRRPLLRDRGRSPTRRFAPAAVATALAVAALLVAPPGRSALAWVGELVGIGEVGGPPTQTPSGLGTSREVVIDNGVAPSGARYEWVVFDCDGGGRGISLEWPRFHGEGWCSREPESGATLASYGVGIVPGERGSAPDLVARGTVGRRVHRLDILYADPRGAETELEVDFARRPDGSGGVFTAFLPGAWVPRDELMYRLNLRETIDRMEPGPLALSERRAWRDAHAACAGRDGERACFDRELPPAPVTYVAYDARGRVLERLREPVTAASEVRPGVGRETPGAERAEGLISPAARKRAEGRAPDGALYEIADERLEGESCAMLWWPYVPEEGGHVLGCGTTAPAATLTDDRLAAPFGSINDRRASTNHGILYGVADPSVHDVRVTYDGDAVPSQLVRRSGFGVWLAFFPPRRDRDAEILVSALDADGRELSRVPHRE
jgi:hypothetical protein